MRSALDFGVLLVTLAVLGGLPSPGAERKANSLLSSPPTTEHFPYKGRAKCFFTPLNGTQLEIRYLLTHIWGRQEFVHFDSRVEEYQAVMPLGEPNAQYWNSQKATLEIRRHQVDRLCRYNYEAEGSFAHARSVHPQVAIIPTDYDPSSLNTLLVCSVTDFYPSEIEIKWLRNGKEEGKSKVATTDLMRNGDWTYQIHIMLETHLERGDLYACQVEHASLNGTVITVQWGKSPGVSPHKDTPPWILLPGLLQQSQTSAQGTISLPCPPGTSSRSPWGMWGGELGARGGQASKVGPCCRCRTLDSSKQTLRT
ncbi:HLA class II histocompatibility antigen, DP beta 1 chain-like [Hemicordylus capensis]|uniref:HLA class II histocompatibility antigen, DP beta 1 chain-like n=1 Tax=Hemicordylus capensis TaxID=884348 RepID=UPI002302A207|nr:HLA class II histocompatibility antigen, DP beta 1 chain-like [Hemicordylus capensis]